MKGLAGVALALLMLAAQPGGATALNVVYGEGAMDMTAVEPLPDNPGRTLGEQRRLAHDHVAKLVERIVWIPDDRPITSQVSWDPSLTAVAAAGVQCETDGQEEFPGIDVCVPQWLLMKQGMDLQEEQTTAVFYAAGRHFNLGLEPAAGAVNYLVASGLHEYIHHMGLASIRASTHEQEAPLFGDYDLHIRLAGDATPMHQMTSDMLDMLLSPTASARWLGTETAKASPRLLMAGYDQGGVVLAVRASKRSTLSHLGEAVRPRSLMAASSEETAELGIVAYMLSDLGWGPVVDSSVSLSLAGQEATARVATDGMAEQLVVRAQLPEKLQAKRVLGSPASCQTTAASVTCTYARLSGAADIVLALSGPVAAYTVAVDVEHRAFHVDPSPANNFASVTVNVMSRGFDRVALSATSVAEGRPAGALVGTLGVVGPKDPGLDYTYGFADGGRHNGCFRIEGDRLLTAGPLDRSAAPRLDIRVRARDSGGFSLVERFQIDVAAASAAFGWRWFAVAHADDGGGAGGALGGGATASLRTLALALLMALLAARALLEMAPVGARLESRPPAVNRRAIHRKQPQAPPLLHALPLKGGVIALLALLLAASCGGGGGGGGGADSPAEPPAFSCGQQAS